MVIPHIADLLYGFQIYKSSTIKPRKLYCDCCTYELVKYNQARQANTDISIEPHCMKQNCCILLLHVPKICYADNFNTTYNFIRNLIPVLTNNT